MATVTVTWKVTESHRAEIDAEVWEEIKDTAEDSLSEYENGESYDGETDRFDVEVEGGDDDA